MMCAAAAAARPSGKKTAPPTIIKVEYHYGSVIDAPVDVAICSVGTHMSCRSGMAKALLDTYPEKMGPFAQRFWDRTEHLEVGDVRVLRDVYSAGRGQLRHIVFTHGPRQAERGEGRGSGKRNDELEAGLRKAFSMSLKAAADLREESIGIPAISAGNGQVDRNIVISVMTNAVEEFLANANHHRLKKIVFIDNDQSVILSIMQSWERKGSAAKPSASFAVAYGSAKPSASSALASGSASSSSATSSARSPVVEEECPICFESFANGKGSVLACQHVLCKDCYDKCSRMNPVCPVCRKAFKQLQGNQPRNGRMTVTRDPRIRLPGYEKCGTIVITYSFPGGIQTAEHPNPGQPYRGVTRTAYLPDDAQGQRVLKLLQDAFNARLTFTVGTSLTSGRTNTVTWNDIHHKTSINGGPVKYGYPDPTYLQRVLEDLEAKGIV